MIRSKDEFYRLFRAGMLGNHGPTWPTLEAYRASGCKRPIMIRTTRPDDPLCKPWIGPRQVLGQVRQFERAGYSLDELYFSEMAPHEHNVLQGEVCWLAELTPGWSLFYSTERHKPMRETLPTSTQVDGLRAKMILEHFMDPNSFHELQTLLHGFPNATVEFTTFAINWGVIPNRNTVIWEVRNY